MELRKLSKAELESFVLCPRLFYYRRIFKKRHEPKLGSIFHDFHWWFWEQIKDYGDSVRNLTPAEHIALMRSLCDQSPPIIRNWAQLYTEWEHERWKIEKEYWHKSIPEFPVEAEIAGIRFIGRIDRIDFTEEGVRIVEIKTGSISKTAWRRETAFYTLVLEQMGVLKEPISSWAVWHPEIQIGGRIHHRTKKAVIKWISKLKTACDKDEFPRKFCTFCPSCPFIKMCVPRRFPSEVFEVLMKTGEVVELF